MANQLPSALKNVEELKEKFRVKKPLLFLDFDGTLAPIVEKHEDAAISEEMRDLVKQLSQVHPTAVVSGRGMKDVSQRVNLPELYYAGSHGFEISGPRNFIKENDEAQKVLPIFDKIEPILKEKLQDIKGVDFERKKFTLAIHYRQVDESRAPEVHNRVSEILKDYPELLKADGKKVIEIRPAIDWHKGKAVEFLKLQLGEKDQNFSVYIGDDVTDEDAFKYIDDGLGILVGDHGNKTYADYSLEDLDEVKEFFKLLLKN
ncbi:trehalose-phosphatase [Salegentibacter sp. F188]|uniref:Trehalose 6-phosphate phosphatase n=1 Tax=Autumnicola patrickiae TaxID=3075591 RepID=A0ABU3E532_9FLAO|nr:trehalose-phosphatase [Salegentibacter sp. F188]MDT0691098.1 trehalose-phosphatase [Salegentibacter sp. F188]